MTQDRQALESQPKVSDRALKRLVMWGGIALVILFATFCVIYYLGQHKNMGPSMVDRQITAGEAAVRADPNNIGDRLSLAQLYAASNRQADALQQYTVVLKALPKNEAALFGKASILFAQNKLNEARDAYNALITVAATGEMAGADPKLQGARYFLAVIAYKQSDFAGAAGQVKEALRLDPTDSDAWYLTAQVAMKQNAPQSAAAAVEKALMFVPSGWCDPYALAINAYTQLKQASQLAFAQARESMCNGDVAAATTGFQSVANGGDKTLATKALLQLAAVSINAGDTNTARGWLNKILAIDPKNAAAKAGLTQLGTPSPSATK